MDFYTCELKNKKGSTEKKKKLSKKVKLRFLRNE